MSVDLLRDCQIAVLKLIQRQLQRVAIERHLNPRARLDAGVADGHVARPCLITAGHKVIGPREAARLPSARDVHSARDQEGHVVGDVDQVHGGALTRSGDVAKNF